MNGIENMFIIIENFIQHVRYGKDKTLVIKISKAYLDNLVLNDELCSS